MSQSSNTEQMHGEVSINRWNLPNWLSLQADKNLMDRQNFQFTMGDSHTFLTKWEVGLKVIGQYVRVYWKLFQSKGFGRNLRVNLKREWFGPNGVPLITDEELRTVSLGQIIEDKRAVYVFGAASGLNSCVNPDGSLTLMITTTVYRGKLPDPIDQMNHDLSHYCELAQKRLCENQASLLEDIASSDLKIITRDGKELAAHKLILKSQCEVFSSMFRNEFAEAATGVIRVDDLSEKTMKILLRYWYTGELSASLFDEDTIIEFTYAAGKYQMTVALEMLNQLMGNRTDKNVSNVDVQLLELAGKLQLGKMEANLLKQITAKINKIKQSQDLFSLFGWNEDTLETEDLSLEDALQIFEDLTDNPEDTADTSKLFMRLLRQVQKLSLKSWR